MCGQVLADVPRGQPELVRVEVGCRICRWEYDIMRQRFKTLCDAIRRWSAGCVGRTQKNLW